MGQPLVDPITGLPYDITNPLIDQLPMDSTPIPLDDWATQGKISQYYYPDMIPATLATIGAQDSTNPQKAQSLQTDGNHALQVAVHTPVDVNVVSGGGGGGGGGGGPAPWNLTLPSQDYSYTTTGQYTVRGVMTVSGGPRLYGVQGMALCVDDRTSYESTGQEFLLAAYDRTNRFVIFAIDLISIGAFAGAPLGHEWRTSVMYPGGIDLSPALDSTGQWSLAIWTDSDLYIFATYTVYSGPA